MRMKRYLSQNDAAVLSRLAEHLLRTGHTHVCAGERLVELIANSILVPETESRLDYVALNSTVTYREVGSDLLQFLDIVCPRSADPGLASVSILTPLALALIGRPVGSITEIDCAGAVKYLHIDAVERLPSADPAKTIAAPALAADQLVCAVPDGAQDEVA